MNDVLTAPFSTHPLFSSHPYFFIFGGILGIAQLNLPDFEPVAPSVCLPRMQIKGPAVFGAGDPGAEDNAKVFNVERCSL